jgi:integrase
MESKEATKDAGDLAQRTYDELYQTCKLFMGVVPPSTPAKIIGPAHFSKVLAAINRKCASPNSRGKFVGQIKSVFKHAYDTGLIERPANFGKSFAKPNAKAYRKHENAKADQTFSCDQIKLLLKHADANAKAMVLLGINAGFLNTELSELPRSAIKGDYLEWPRAKTCTFRRVKLWTETKAAIDAAIKAGPIDGELVFYRSKNRDFSDTQRNGRHIGRLFETVLHAAKIEGHSFRDLRYTFATIAEEAPNLDPPAIRLIMGHTDSNNDMAARYRQRISDERLCAVCDHVRQWLFGSAAKKGGAK